MRHKQIADQPKTFALIFDTGDEILSDLSRFAAEQNLTAGSFQAIGALSRAQLGWFDWQRKNYQTAVDLDEQVEPLSLIGDVAVEDGKPKVHAHMVVSRRDGTAHGGHLLAAHVRPTCELVLTESPAHLQKQIDPESGLALIRL